MSIFSNNEPRIADLENEAECLKRRINILESNLDPNKEKLSHNLSRTIFGIYHDEISFFDLKNADELLVEFEKPSVPKCLCEDVAMRRPERLEITTHMRFFKGNLEVLFKPTLQYNASIKIIFLKKKIEIELRRNNYDFWTMGELIISYSFPRKASIESILQAINSLVYELKGFRRVDGLWA